MSRLSAQAVSRRLAAHPDWALVGGKLRLECTFADFVTAFAFMTQVAELAEQHNHHPEWFNCYNQVTIELTTHDHQGVTERDFSLAADIDAIRATPS